MGWVGACGPRPSPRSLQGYLTHKKQRSLRTLQWYSEKGPLVVLGDGAVSYERGSLHRCFRVRSQGGYGRMYVRTRVLYGPALGGKGSKGRK